MYIENMPIISTEAVSDWPRHAVPLRETLPPIYLNGRFLVQPQTGVQRFATEACLAMQRAALRTGLPQPQVLTPPDAGDGREAAQALGSRPVGRGSGQVWEQCALARHAANGILINLGNTAPVFARRQIVVIHDAGVFRRPEAYALPFRIWYRVLQRLLVLRRVRIVTVSAFSRQEIALCLHCPPERIAVVSESGDHVRRVLPDRSVLAEFGLVPGRFVLAVGNLAAHKNLSALGATARMLAERGLTLAITGGLDRTVFDSVRDSLPAPAIHVGRVSDSALAALYQAANCFVFPSTYEGFGLPALEAMELGCPVVAASIPALREVCGDAAAFCDPFDPADIAQVVARVADDPDHRRELARRGQARCAVFTWDRTGEQLLALVRGMATSGG